jgi:hypothetical protein
VWVGGDGPWSDSTGCGAAADRASPFLFSAAEANAVCTFVEQLPHVEGRWTTDTIRLEPWHLHPRGVLRFRLRPDGRRLVTTVFFQVARKSAKSTLVAAVALYHLTVEREPGGQVVYATSTGQQAVSSSTSRSAWCGDPCGFASRGFQVFANSIVCDARGGTMKPIKRRRPRKTD